MYDVTGDLGRVDTEVLGQVFDDAQVGLMRYERRELVHGDTRGFAGRQRDIKPNLLRIGGENSAEVRSRFLH